MSDATDDTNSNATQQQREAAREDGERQGVLGHFVFDVFFELLWMFIVGVARFVFHLAGAILGAIASIFTS
jgi:hypothetical protein